MEWWWVVIVVIRLACAFRFLGILFVPFCSLFSKEVTFT